jgi:MYXO-CTERM domain-containing protein
LARAAAAQRRDGSASISAPGFIALARDIEGDVFGCTRGADHAPQHATLKGGFAVDFLIRSGRSGNYASMRALGWSWVTSVGVLLTLAPAAEAQLAQPAAPADMPQPVTVPRAVSQNEINDATGAVQGILPGVANPGQFVTLPALFQYLGENINFQTDAKTEPSTFSPLCSFSGTLVLRGGGCKLAFGWYNAVMSGGAPPPANEIYPLIPNNDPVVYGGPAFTPLAMDGPWTLKTFTAADIRNDMRYKGGQIGFALIGGGQCSQTKYSQRELNQKCTSCTPADQSFITTVVYKGTKEPNSYYMGFEDLPVSPTSFLANNDGDFNDFVFYITGLVCAGGGEPCDTGKMGACALGKTDCSENEEPGQCRDVVKPTDEKCDNVDNDCNGQVDDGDLCPVGKVCDHGSCVPACNTGEFRCAKPLVCDRGFCLDPLCANRAEPCPEGTACRAGNCVGACDDVKCPTGQECQLGHCVDLCAGVVCEEKQVCENGLCMAECGCRGCGPGLTCAASGKCVDTGCETQTCQGGQVCVQGVCKDACEGAVCPGGAACTAGQCAAPPTMEEMSGGGSSGGGNEPPIVIDLGGKGGAGSGGSSVIPPSAGQAGTGNTGNNGDNGVVKKDGTAAGCACRVGDRSGSGSFAWLGLAGAVAVWVRRRRRLAA